MKNIFKYIIIGGICLGMASCEKDFIDLEPTGSFQDNVYFKTPSDFKAFSAGLYGQLQGWSFGNMDNNTDLSANIKGENSDLGHGTIDVNSSGWKNQYEGVRSCNILLSRSDFYTGDGDISTYVGEAYFFRAYNYFNLLKSFGGVPIITTVLDVNSPELYGPRNSRYEVVNLILEDLDKAISRLPIEQNIASNDKGKISKWAAMAFKAQVELYEATWEKYNGQDLDGDGVTVGGGTAAYDASNRDKYLADVIASCEEIMNNGGYELWNKDSDATMGNKSMWYLFNLEDSGSNPGGYDKSTNKEFILYSVYDFVYRKSNINITWTVGQHFPSRKFVDMPVCTDGLPADKSPLFQGYHAASDEFKNRDLRLLNYLYASNTVTGVPTLEFGTLGFSGYSNSKYAVYGYGTRRLDNTESANWSIIRLAEVYLMYAEAIYELNGSITDAQLNASINKLRDRAGVAHLTNALVTANGLNMKEEIRRERAVELYREGKRFDDLKRWGILEESLNPSRLGRVVGDASYITSYKDVNGNATSSYKPQSYVFGEEAVATPAGVLKCVVIDSKNNHSVVRKHYLYPIPTSQIRLNSKLLQNPGYN